MRPYLPAFLACALMLAGCMAELPTSDPVDPVAAEPPVGAQAGSATTHGTPQRVDGPVTIRMEGTSYVAERNITITNDFGGAALATVTLSTSNGAVNSFAGGNGGYRLTALLNGRGSSEQEARNALASMEVVPADLLSGGKLALGLEVRFNDIVNAPNPLPPLPVTTGSQGRGASIVAVLPAQPSLELDASSSNGALSVRGLHGAQLALDTSNGAIHAEGAWDDLRLDTSNGAIRIDGVANQVDASTSNGAIHADVEVRRTASQAYHTSNGGIDVKVMGNDDTGFDATASTSNAEATVTVDGQEESGSDEAHVRSAGFTGKAIQVTIDADTSNGRAEVEAS